VDTFNLEQTLKQIVEIDERAIELQKQLEGVKGEYEKKLKKAMKSVDSEFMKAARKKGKRINADMMADIEKEEQLLREESYAECKQLDEIMKANKSQLVMQVFERVILADKEV